MGHAIVIAAIFVNLSDAPPALIDTAKEEVVALFAEIGIVVRWLDDDARGTGPGVWRVVVLPAAPGPAVRFYSGALGSVGSHAIAAPVAWVFFKEIQQLAWRRHVPVRALLSRAIAHEVGHLLQGVKGHTRTGLMRPYLAWHRFPVPRARRPSLHPGRRGVIQPRAGRCRYPVAPRCRRSAMARQIEIVHDMTIGMTNM